MKLKLPHELIPWIFERFGTVWLVVAVAAMAYFCFGRLLRALIGVMFLLICTQCWYAPLYHLARELRWYALGALCVRGLLLLSRHRAPPGETRAPHFLLYGLGVLAIASAAWAASGSYTLAVAASFGLGIVITFGLLWRLLDTTDVLPVFARAAVGAALLVFGAGFLVAYASNWSGSWLLLERTGLGGRFSGVFINANMSGLFGAMLLPVVVGAPRTALGSVASVRWIAILLLAAGIFLSGSRSALLGSCFALVAILLYRFGAGGLLMLSLAGVGGVALALNGPTLQELDDTAVGHITRTKHLHTLSGRFDLWEEGWEAAQGTLLLGRGWGESRVLEEDKSARAQALRAGAVVHGSNLHNAHLQLLVDVGFLGLGMFWLFCLLVLRAGWRVLRAPRSPRHLLVTIVFASVVAMLGDTFVHGSIFSTGSPMTLVFWGFCVVVLKEADRLRRGAPAPGAEAPIESFRAGPAVALPA